MFETKLRILCLLLVFYVNVQCDIQVGPDPWDLEVKDKVNHVLNEVDIPPDLRTVPKKKILGNGAGAGDWFYKRMLAIMLKGGQVKKNEDGTVVVSLQMKFDEERWQLLDGYTAIHSVVTEDMIRRSMGYIEEAIYKPTIVEKVVLAWSEYIYLYFIEYKMHITWAFGILALSAAGMWSWKHMSHKHIYTIIFIILYLYEVFTSYKEAEKEELQRFLSAINRCKWSIWSSHCDVPSPDPLIFIKHMNPLKIGIRMFTTVITEPMISISETVKILIHGITDGLWFPVDKIVYGILIVSFNFLLILFLIMIVFNYILNIPFNFSFLGLLNIGVKQRNRTFNITVSEPPRTGESDRISGATLDRLLDVCSRALCTAQTAQNTQNVANPTLQLSSSTSSYKIRRSASTGRLPNLSHENFDQLQIQNSTNLSKNIRQRKFDGSGDASL
ncbi:uncharacterized protein [Epargyreus clarus]|uniref:uncharacterized protein n=1 Tax=Epargyreus clarus TaxID=520877 RepID=UPI003C2EA6BA